MIYNNIRHMKYWNIFLITGIFILTFSISGYSQNKENLEQQRKKMLQEIKYTNKILSQNQAAKKTNLNQLLILKKNIRTRERIIASYATEIKIISIEISDNEDRITEIENEIKILKDEYAKLIYSAYKNRHGYDKWMFILSSEDFNQAYRRLKYLKQFTDYRVKQVELVKEEEVKLQMEITKLNAEKLDKERLKKQEDIEAEKLDREKIKINSVVKDLKKKERALKKEIKKRKREAAQIKKAVEKILAEEERKRKAALKSNKATGEFALTPEESLISEQFGSNKGKFPWPTERGIVIRTYGEHSHPILRGIKTFNNGLDINTNEGAVVRAIFAGEVRDVWAIQGRNMAVIIKHGEYFTVYQNLSNVMVRPGDKVDIKESIGTVFTDKNDGNVTMLHIEIWKGSNRQNPAYWLARK